MTLGACCKRLADFGIVLGGGNRYLAFGADLCYEQPLLQLAAAASIDVIMDVHTNRARSMSRRFKHFIQGIRQAFVLMPEAEYHRPQKGGFAEDARNLRGDAARVCSDLYSVTEKCGKQIQDGQA